MQNVMGCYTKNLAKRVLLRGSHHGNCAIFGLHSKLTEDHVPPKSCGNIKDAIVRRMFPDAYNGKFAHTISQGGLRFKTICSNCNNTLLGTEYDPALEALANEIKHDMEESHRTKQLIPGTKSYYCQPNRLIRSVLGHLLASMSVETTTENKPTPPLDALLQEYVLDPTKNIQQEISIYYWLYPANKKAIKHGAIGFMGTNGQCIYGHVSKFFPLGFWVTYNEKTSGRWKINGRKFNEFTCVNIDALARLPIDF